MLECSDSGSCAGLGNMYILTVVAIITIIIEML